MMTQDEIHFDEKKIIENSLNLWTAIIIHEKTLIPSFYEFCTDFKKKYNKSFVLSGLTLNGNKQVREEFYQAFLVFSQTTYIESPPYIFISRELFQNIPSNENVNQVTSDAQFFSLLCNLVD
jgi:ubiquitin carboxyl-terminal hydrolase 34